MTTRDLRTALFFYYGCAPSGHEKGHFLFHSGRDDYSWQQTVGPFNRHMLDANYAPTTAALRERGLPFQDDSVVALTHEQGWTVLAMWDRSVDTRYGSNAVFVAEGTWSEADMWRRARAAFPMVVRRLRAAPKE